MFTRPQEPSQKSVSKIHQILDTVFSFFAASKDKSINRLVGKIVLSFLKDNQSKNVPTFVPSYHNARCAVLDTEKMFKYAAIDPSTNMPEVKLFSCSASHELAAAIADHYQTPLSDKTLAKFSDGEMQPIINESIRGSFTFFIQSTCQPHDNLVELLLWIDCAKRASAGYITAVVPYFGYARQDRKDKPRVPISAKLMANLLTTAGADRIMTMDLHADQVQGFFDIPVDHLRSEAIYMPYLAETDLSHIIFASPDVGGVKRARSYAMHFGRELVICDKYRTKANEVASMTVIGDVKGADVILVDDLVDTAGTLCKAADALLEKGARSVKAICTHPVLSGKAYENINNSKLTELIVCDTIPLTQQSDKIKVLSTAKLFSRAIRNTIEYKSIAALFLQK